jgi:hypothetical protein
MRHRFGVRAVVAVLSIAASSFAKPPVRAAAKPKPAPTATTEAAPAEAAPTPPPEAPVKAAGTKETKEPKDGKNAQLTHVEESAKDKGVKTYKFSAIEVEGRLKSPQIIYFLRRVRAEFEAGDLGHRSFMPELSDTRRSPSLK